MNFLALRIAVQKIVEAYASLNASSSLSMFAFPQEENMLKTS
jgi:hypothetical protein